jgi:hypothetical protein
MDSSALLLVTRHLQIIQLDHSLLRLLRTVACLLDSFWSGDDGVVSIVISRPHLSLPPFWLLAHRQLHYLSAHRVAHIPLIIPISLLVAVFSSGSIIFFFGLSYRFPLASHIADEHRIPMQIKILIAVVPLICLVTFSRNVGFRKCRRDSLHEAIVPIRPRDSLTSLKGSPFPSNAFRAM